MAATDRQETADLIEELFQHNAPEWNFFLAMRKLDTVSEQQAAIGKGIKASDEQVLFSQNPSLAFPASSIHSFIPEKDDHRARFIFEIIGFFSSILQPYHISSIAISERNPFPVIPSNFR